MKATVAADEKPPVDLFKSIFSDSESESEKEDSESETETENLTIKKTDKPIEKSPEELGKPNATGKLSWSRFEQPPKAEQLKSSNTVKTENEPEPELDEFDRPKFTFTAKKDRTTTKTSFKHKDVKMQPVDEGYFYNNYIVAQNDFLTGIDR